MPAESELSQFLITKEKGSQILASDDLLHKHGLKLEPIEPITNFYKGIAGTIYSRGKVNLAQHPVIPPASAQFEPISRIDWKVPANFAHMPVDLILAAEFAVEKKKFIIKLPSSNTISTNAHKKKKSKKE
jgi:hypothetical protein